MDTEAALFILQKLLPLVFMKGSLFLKLLIESDSGKDNCYFQASNFYSLSLQKILCQYYYTTALHVLICTHLVHNYTCGFAERNLI